MESGNRLWRPFAWFAALVKQKGSPEEQNELHKAAAAAAAGREVPAELIKSTPPRTLRCTGHEFKRLRGLALTGMPLSVCCLPVLNPLGSFYRLWLLLTNATDMTYTAFIVALSIAFNTNGTFDNNSWLDIADLVGSIIYFADILLGFHVGFITRWDTRAVVVRDGRAVALFYILHGTFFVDLIATLPAFAQAGAMLTALMAQVIIRSVGSSKDKLRLLYIMRLLRLLRVVRLLKNITPGVGAGTSLPMMALVSTRSLMLFNALFSLAVLVNLMGCVWWNLAVNEGLDNSWAAAVSITKPEIDLLNSSDSTRWLVSVYFALTTVATIGYGDITPVTTAEVGATVLFELVGVAFFGYVVSVATSILSASGPSARRAEAIREKLEDVEHVMAQLSLPRFLRRRVRTFYSEQWVPPEDEGGHDLRFKLLMELPARLRIRVVQEAQESALAELGFLPPNLPPKQRKHVHQLLAAASVPMRLAAGQELSSAVPEVAAADARDVDRSEPCIFILNEGEMRALRPGEGTAKQRWGYIGGRVDFAGPAVIGLTALFMPEGSDTAYQGGVTPGPGNGSSGSGSSLGGGGGDGKQGGSKSGSESGSKGGDLDHGSSYWRGETSRVWQQSALALTECHLWRVNCRQLFLQLRERHPAVLLHLLDSLLRTLGVHADAAELASWEDSTARTSAMGDLAGGAGEGPGALGQGAAGAGSLPSSPAGRHPRRQPSFRTAAVTHLLHLRRDLVAAATSAAVSISRPATPPAERFSWLTRSFQPSSGPKELLQVSVSGLTPDKGGGPAGQDLPDVWQTNG